MGTAARSRLRVHPAIIVPVIVLAVALIVVVVGQIVPLAVAGQAYLLIVIALGFRYWPPMAAWVRGMPVPHRLVFGGLLGAMIVGHFTLDARTYYPFVAWEIFPFVREDDPVTCREFVATTASGQSVRLLVEQLFPSIIQFNPPATDSIAMTRLVQAMATIYNQHHPRDPVQTIDIRRLAVRLHPAKDAPPLPCPLLKHYDVSSARSN